MTQSASTLWHLLRSKRITAGKVGLCAKRISKFEILVKQLNPTRRIVTAPMRRGIELEPHAAMIYADKAKSEMVNLYPNGLVICPKSPWLGCSPDRNVYDITAAVQGLNPFGLLEVKIVKEVETDFKNVSYVDIDPLTNEKTLKKSHEYYFQVLCQLAITGMEWCDFFLLPELTILFFVRESCLTRIFFQESKDKVDQFFFQYFLQ